MYYFKESDETCQKKWSRPPNPFSPAEIKKSRAIVRPASVNCHQDFGYNKSIFEELHSHKDKIEEAFGGLLEWQRLEGRRACRIRKIVPIGGYRDDEKKWPQIHEAMVDAMIRLEKSLKPYIAKLSY